MYYLVINTQYRENYGTREQPYWKFKGGTTYIYENLTEKQAEKIRLSGIHNLSQYIETYSPAWEEYVINYSVTTSPPELEEYEAPVYIKYENKQWLAEEVQNNYEGTIFLDFIRSRVRTWTMLPGGDLTNLKELYEVNDRFITYDELQNLRAK